MDPTQVLADLGKKLGVKDMLALNDFIDASILTALEPILERLTALEYRLSQSSNPERVAQISSREFVGQNSETEKRATPKAPPAACFHIFCKCNKQLSEAQLSLKSLSPQY